MFKHITKVSDLKPGKGFDKKIVKKGSDIVATEDMYILVPARYENAGLLEMTNTVSILAAYMLVDSKLNFINIITPTIITTEPAEIDNITLDGVDYLVFKYYKDSPIVKGTMLPMNDGFAYDLFKEFLMKGNIPEFIDYDNLYKLFSTMGEFTGSNITADMVSIEILISLAYRSKKDSSVYYRQVLGKPGDNTPYDTVPINNIERGIEDPLAILTGSYVKRSITKLLTIEDSERTKVSNIERILMK